MSNFGDGDSEADEIHTHAREVSRRRDAREGRFSSARVYFAEIAKISDCSQSKHNEVHAIRNKNGGIGNQKPFDLDQQFC